MLRRALALLVLAAGSFAMAACADVTGPDTDSTPSLSACGVYAGTGTCSK